MKHLLTTIACYLAVAGSAQVVDTTYYGNEVQINLNMSELSSTINQLQYDVSQLNGVQTTEDVFSLLENQITNLQSQLDSLSQSPPSYELGEFQGHGCSETSPSSGAGGQIMFCDVEDSIFVPSGYFFELTIGYQLSFSGYGRSAKCELSVDDDNGGPISGVFRASDGATGISSSISRNFQLPHQDSATSSHSTSGNFSFRFVATSDTTLVITRQVSGNTINYAWCDGNNCGGVSGSMTMAYELYKP
jgi:hypothetical protein